MKKSAALYLSAREASAELAISPATLYAYVSRGLIRSEPSPDSRSHRYRAEDVRGLKERRVPAPEPRGLRSFDADLPVMDSEIDGQLSGAKGSTPLTSHNRVAVCSSVSRSARSTQFTPR